MALLRECLQELRVKRREWPELPGGWPASKPAGGANRVDRRGAGPLRPAAPVAPSLRTA